MSTNIKMAFLKELLGLRDLLTQIRKEQREEQRKQKFIHWIKPKQGEKSGTEKSI